MDNDQKRMFLAVALSAVVLMTWQFFIAPQHIEQPNQLEQKAAETQQSQNNESSINRPSLDQSKTLPSDRDSADQEKKTTKQTIKTESLVLSNSGHRFNFTNLLSVQNITNEAAVFDFRSISGSDFPFKVELLTTSGSEGLGFVMEETQGNILRGKNKPYNISFEAKLLDNGRLDFHLSSDRDYRYRFIFNSEKKESGNQMVREFIYYTNDVSREAVGEAASGDGHFKWFGLDYNYHLFAFVLKEKARTRFEMTENGQFVIDMLDGQSDFYGDLLFTKKNYDLLTDLGDNLHLSVDFGLFGIIAVPILRGLEFFYSLIPNYCVAILFLTLLIRLLTFPLQYKSFKSMKKMQVIQPQLQKVREKYKEDPQKLQKETMELFKKSGANPLGGCLPLLAQMPIFFAFYQVLYNAVELVGAPFAFWIVDLSVKDPYYVLPVLMGASLFMQMKLNPTPTTDPMQKKVMMFMPLIFLFIMKDLPAGLNLYIFISTIFGIAQQLFVYKMTD